MMEFLQKNGIYQSSIEDDSYAKNINSLDQCRIMIMIVLRYLSVFSHSDEYMSWSRNIETKQNYLCQSLKRLMHHECCTSEEEESFAMYDEFGPKGLDYVHLACFDDIYESYYLYNFIGKVECLPIGITLSQVMRDKKGSMTDFIIIYANEMYSWMSGYIRKELVGCKFTDFNKEAKRDVGVVNRFVSDNLHQSNSFITMLNNYCKNGDSVQQLLGVKPIFDSNGTYAYVIGIHIDVTIEHWSDDLMTILLSKLPSRLSALEL